MDPFRCRRLRDLLAAGLLRRVAHLMPLCLPNVLVPDWEIETDKGAAKEPAMMEDGPSVALAKPGIAVSDHSVASCTVGTAVERA